jgi:hypothetical protein
VSSGRADWPAPELGGGIVAVDEPEEQQKQRRVSQRKEKRYGLAQVELELYYEKFP